MERSETCQMSLICRPARMTPVIRMALRLWDRHSCRLPTQPWRIQVRSCSRLLLVQLIFLVADMLRNHGHAP
jgi:hypothetical protein